MNKKYPVKEILNAVNLLLKEEEKVLLLKEEEKVLLLKDEEKVLKLEKLVIKLMTILLNHLQILMAIMILLKIQQKIVFQSFY